MRPWPRIYRRLHFGLAALVRPPGTPAGPTNNGRDTLDGTRCVSRPRAMYATDATGGNKLRCLRPRAPGTYAWAPPGPGHLPPERQNAKEHARGGAGRAPPHSGVPRRPRQGAWVGRRGRGLGARRHTCYAGLCYCLFAFLPQGSASTSWSWGQHSSARLCGMSQRPPVNRASLQAALLPQCGHREGTCISIPETPSRRCMRTHRSSYTNTP